MWKKQKGASSRALMVFLFGSPLCALRFYAALLPLHVMLTTKLFRDNESETCNLSQIYNWVVNNTHTQGRAEQLVMFLIHLGKLNKYTQNSSCGLRYTLFGIGGAGVKNSIIRVYGEAKSILFTKNVKFEYFFLSSRRDTILIETETKSESGWICQPEWIGIYMHCALLYATWNLKKMHKNA